MKISAELLPHEAELVSGLFRKEIVALRHEAKLKHAVGEMTRAELNWCQRHADYIENVHVKLFGVKP